MNVNKKSNRSSRAGVIAEELRVSQGDTVAQDQRLDGLIINEAQLVLAEKRTSLSTLRTGIAVLALPLTMLSLLIVASRYYVLDHVLGLLLPVIIVCAGLLVLGAYLVSRAILKVNRADRLLHQLKMQHSILSPFIE